MDELEAIATAALRDLLLAVRERPEGMSTQEAARHSGVAVSVARWRLERLREAGLVTARFQRLTGRGGPGAGRPAKVYTAVPKALEFPPRYSDELVDSLLEALPHRRRADRLGMAGRTYGLALARLAGLEPGMPADQALQRVTEALARLGIPVAVEAAGPSHGCLSTGACPLRGSVRRRPELHATDRAMWETLVAAALREGGHDRVTCTMTGCLESTSPCRIDVSVG